MCNLNSVPASDVRLPDGSCWACGGLQGVPTTYLIHVCSTPSPAHSRSRLPQSRELGHSCCAEPARRCGDVGLGLGALSAARLWALRYFGGVGQWSQLATGHQRCPDRPGAAGPNRALRALPKATFCTLRHPQSDQSSTSGTSCWAAQHDTHMPLTLRVPVVGMPDISLWHL